ncbi:MAG TPA: hypothetical protein VH044_02915 [Polyangiaceae bacterium]|jgi:hypothetical protein|nr:hypothetical protein [Polyangiaceae bacterium]
MKRLSLGVVGALFVGVAGLLAFASFQACGGQTGPGATPSDAGVDATMPYAAECAGAASPPNTLECTGLYTDIVAKTLSPGIQPYAPAVPLWSDYAEKQRWISLPPGTTIDATNPDDWIFPVGTKVWKEFSRDGKRVETRLWQKVQSTFWVRATYAWNADETEATSSMGGDMPWGTDGGVYHIPTGDECDQCHRGRTDHLLGFEQVSLGLAGATGLTLSELVTRQLITPAPANTHLVVGDDGTGLAAGPLAWIHINCGASCHNDNSNSTAYGSTMRLRLDPTQLDGRSSVNFDARTTTMGELATTPTWVGQPRVVPGDPTHSLLVKLITNRGTNNPVANQMPPIASLLVDPVDTQSVIAWIAKMPPLPSEAGGNDAMAGGPDGASDAGADGDAAPDASVEGGALVDASGGDAGVDAGAHDAAIDGD